MLPARLRRFCCCCWVNTHSARSPFVLHAVAELEAGRDRSALGRLIGKVRAQDAVLIRPGGKARQSATGGTGGARSSLESPTDVALSLRHHDTVRSSDEGYDEQEPGPAANVHLYAA